MRGPSPSGLKIGFSPDLGYAVVDSDVARIVEDAARAFERLGHRLMPVRGGPPDLVSEWGLLSTFEIGARIAPLLPEHEAEFTRGVMRTIQIARGIDQAWWGETARKRAALVRWVAKTFSEFDLLAHSHRALRSTARKGTFPVRDRRPPPAGFGRRRDDDPVQPVVESGGQRARRDLAQPVSRWAFRSSAHNTATTWFCSPPAPSSASAPGIPTGPEAKVISVTTLGHARKHRDGM